jgi:transcriptional regulator with XRE-family HTH domain
MDLNKFAIRLRELRKERQLTQGELAGRLNLTKQAVSQWERGIREPGFETLEMIADFFNVDTDYLIGREDRTTLLLNGIEHELIVRFRELSPAERSIVLRSVGVNEHIE